MDKIELKVTKRAVWGRFLAYPMNPTGMSRLK